MVSVILILCTVFTLFLLHKTVIVLYCYLQTIRLARQVPGFPDTRLIQGDLWVESYDDYMEKTLKFVQSTGVKMHKIWVYFFYPFYCLNHPDTVKLILKASVPKDSHIGSGYTILKPWIGDGLLTSIGDRKWARNRRLLTTAFHFDILNNYIMKFNIVAEDLLIRLSQCRNSSIEICQPVSISTLDALLQCAFSYDGHIQELGLDHPYVSAVQELSSYCVKRMSNPVLHPDFIFNRTRTGKRFHQLCNYVHEFADDIIEARRNILETDHEDTEYEYTDFLDIVLMAQDENGVGLTDKEIRAEVDTFLFAGHDTTSSAISWAIYTLGQYPEIQEQIYEEVMQVVGTKNVEPDHLSKLKYMLFFIKEVMRMYSIVPVIGRSLKEPLTIDGVTLPAGALIEINIHTMNHNPAVWSDHEDFRPDRFSESEPERDPFSFIPFSAGTRNCIGQNFALNELKVVLSRLVQAFRIELDTSHEVVPQPKLVMRPKNGIKVFLRSR
ncbi:ultra-long-chain fatty acid omega-hydroxylase-like [Mercenaria mercenaria]|uniref:ultra-long-chain fatty acid omega-hydroxylase-like n=1 Tax=Mercenaria mercenaria TaxID=6596 RepID=UPI00234F3651|nr:ultra-long-chain fatty acid omega-hydroxylase-like [Mercenaria mercenaria]